MANEGRQMATAPRPERVEAPAAKPAPGANRFDAIFTGVVFKPAAANAKVYGKGDDDDGDRASKKLATVLVELCRSEAHLVGSIKAVQNKGEAEPHAEFLFQASQFGGQCIKAESNEAAAELSAWRDKVVDDYLAWREQNGSGPAISGKPIKGMSSLL